MDRSEPAYEIGLVMAGAVSAGAYTAGVADFLIEALDAWERARADRDPLAPAHRVRLRAMAGASAGAMTAAMVAGIAAGRPHRPVSGLADPGVAASHNVLFDSWVNRVDADHLLATDDLEHTGDARLFSLLNGRVLDDIARQALPSGVGTGRRPWIAGDLRLAFAVTNLRGVPYNVGFGDHSHAPEPRPGHSMRKHADLLRFRLGDAAVAAPADLVTLDWQMQGEGWSQLRNAALASGAFPLLLPPRALARPGSDYDARLWAMPARGEVGGGEPCLRYQPLPPHWGAAGTPMHFDFLAVDGGVLDNEPFAAGRDLLVGVPPMPASGDVLGRALLSIDPFPDVLGYRPDEPQPGGLLDTALALIAAMRNQTRFKPDELVTAFDDPYASRQLIAPSRRIGEGARMDHPLAGGAVDGFAGFLDRGFRLHDFMLGRANCQRFVQRHFRLPATHPLFRGWHAAQRAAFDDGSGTLPVIPLLAQAADPLAAPPWPRIAPERLAQVKALMRTRVRALMPVAIDHLLARSTPPMRWLTRVLASFQSKGWVNALADHMAGELRRRDQL